eukprot:358621-Chlamydomonas_euryale.AAC.3
MALTFGGGDGRRGRWPRPAISNSPQKGVRFAGRKCLRAGKWVTEEGVATDEGRRTRHGHRRRCGRRTRPGYGRRCGHRTRHGHRRRWGRRTRRGHRRRCGNRSRPGRRTRRGHRRRCGNRRRCGRTLRAAAAQTCMKESEQQTGGCSASPCPLQRRAVQATPGEDQQANEAARADELEHALLPLRDARRQPTLQRALRSVVEVWRGVGAEEMCGGTRNECSRTRSVRPGKCDSACLATRLELALRRCLILQTVCGGFVKPSALHVLL